MKSKFADTLSGNNLKPLAAFDPNFERFATVTPDNRLKIWDAVSGSLIKECFEASHLTTNYTSLAWGSTKLQAANGEQPESKRSRKKKSSGRVESGVIALGTEKGLVVVWDLQRGEVHLKLGEKGDGHTSSVTGVAFNNNGSYLYSCSTDMHVIQWSVDSGKILTKFQADKQPIGAMALSPDNTVLATASTHIRLWDLASKKALKKFTGHAKPVVDMTFSGDGQYLLSSARDRFLSLWSCEGDSDEISKKKESKGAIHVFASSGSTAGLVFNTKRPKGRKQLEFLGLSEAGEVCIWKYAPDAAKEGNKEQGKGKGLEENKKSNKSSKVDGAIRLPEEEGQSKTRSIICANFSSKDSIIVAHSTGVNPIFEKLRYRDSETGIVRPEIVLTVSSQSTLLPSKGQEQTKPTEAERPKTKVLGPTDMRLPNPKPETVDKKLNKNKEPTLQEKVEAMEIASKKEKEKERETKSHSAISGQTLGADVAPKAESLQAVLMQALHTNDRSLMESVLGVSDPAIIANTVSRLPPKFVLPFLNEVIDRFRAKPGRGVVLITWIKAILLHHASYLMSLPNLQEALSGLYQTVDARVNSFKGFLKLSGRLDLVLSQIEQHQNQPGVSVMHSLPLAVYNEESDEDDDDDEEENEEQGGVDSEAESDEDRMDEDDDEDEEEDEEDEIMLDRKRK